MMSRAYWFAIFTHFRFVFGDLSWEMLSLQRRDEPDELAAVFDVGGVALVPIDSGGIGCVKDRGDVRLDGDPALVAGLVRVGENFTQLGLAETRHGVFGLHIIGNGVDAVLDVDVGDVVFHLEPEIQRVLPRERFGLGAIELENGISRIKDELQAWDFLDKA